MHEEGRGEVGLVDIAGHDAADAGAPCISRCDLVLQAFTVDGGRRGAEAVLPLCADLGEQHLSRVTPKLAHPSLPPAMAGTMDTVSPVLSSVLRPSRKRMSSSPM